VNPGGGRPQVRRARGGAAGEVIDLCASPLRYGSIFSTVASTWRWMKMSTKELLEKALKLKPEDRFILVEGLLKSLDEPDKELEEIWAEEAKKRLNAYREGKLEGIPMEDVF
jgi:putative addiction module component (TIGR02574 family)